MKEVSFTLFSSLFMKKFDFDITYSQPGRFFSPNVVGMHFCSKSWLEYKRQNKLNVGFSDLILPGIEAHNLNKATKIVTVSNFVKKEIIKYHDISEEKISVIHNGVDTKEFHPKNKKIYRGFIRNNLGLFDDDLVLLLIGNPLSRKGLKYLIKAYKNLKTRAKLLVVSRDNPQKYQDLSSRLGLNDRIIFGDSKLPAFMYFAASDIFVLPTLYEPFGLVVLEAMASGLPVVVSKNAGAAELVTDGKDSLLLDNPKNVRELQEKLLYLITNESVRKKLSMNAKKCAEKNSWDNVAKRMLEVFKSLGD